ncbi:MAG: hypothetical protein ABUL60_32915 [Myxococcales bacterium]
MSTRAERRKRVAARVAAGELPGRRVTHYQVPDIRAAMQAELAAQRAAIDSQRAARDKAWAFRSGVANGAVSHTPIQTHRP